MTFFPWTDELVVGFDQIDEQHRWLVDMTNKLHDELAKPNPDRAAVGEILEGLMDYTMNHFIVEEDLFQRHGYPETLAHKAEHDRFTSGIMELLDRFEEGADINDDALNLLKDWLTHHILTVDKGYAPFFKEKGIT